MTKLWQESCRINHAEYIKQIKADQNQGLSVKKSFSSATLKTVWRFEMV
jgi:hypothetical protein